LKDGDFLILDAGPDYADYHADISMTFPASGKFSPRQKELYEVALAVRNTCQANYKPGVTFGQVGEKVATMLKEKGLDKYAADLAHALRHVARQFILRRDRVARVERASRKDRALAARFISAH